MPRLFELLSGNTEKQLRAKHGAQRDTRAKRPASRESPRRGASPGTRKTGEVPAIAVPDFVAVDLETTGLDYRNDRIIEVGAVRFEAGRPLEEFSTFVSPGVAVPEAITQLTGISDAQLAGAPRFTDIASKLLAFLGDLPLCGHQVEFDINFLNEELRRLAQNRLPNPQLDSASLSRLALPGLQGYSLSQVAQALGIELLSAHRALDDARASGAVASALIPRLAEIPAHVRYTMARFAPHSVLKTLLFESVGKREPRTASPPCSLPKLPKRLAEPGETAPVEERAISECFSAEGALSKAMRDYAPRPAQEQMALAVAQALNDGFFLVAEAGTGVGKSLAYLVPAACWAFKNNTRVLVSSYTRNIGDQLIKRDLPVVKQVVGAGFTYSVLKGRANYLCMNRWRRLLAGQHGNLSPRERFAILPLIRWAEETGTGDIEEQNLFNRKWFAKVWNLISAEAHDCEGWRCPHSEECFLQRARRAAQGSHVVVINHALFFSEICAESSFLGTLGPIVFDEAHHLEACGHRHLRVELDTNRINRFLESLDSLLKAVGKGPSEAHGSDEGKRFKTALKHMRKSSLGFLTECEMWVRSRYGDAPAAYQLAYHDRPFAACASLAGFEIDIRELQDALIALQRLWRERGDEKEAVYSDIVACLERASQLKADLDYLTTAYAEDHVFWVEGNLEKGWVKLCGVPLDIGELLADIWKKRTGPVIFTSATLSVLGSIDFFKEKVGLDRIDGGKVLFEDWAKPFSPQQVFRCAVRSPMEPDADGYCDYVAGSLARLLQRFEKNILVLFTSNAMLAGVCSALRGRSDVPVDASVLAQHLSGSRQVMLEQFKRSRRAALLGTESFWEGIDVPGSECEIVVVPRLPFLVPTHPLTQALARRYEERCGDSFRSYTVPEAIIRFRQGAGRLIRSAADRGAFVVLDSRITGKSYGKMFMRSLGGNFVFSESVDEMVALVGSFFETGQFVPSGGDEDI